MNSVPTRIERKEHSTVREPRPRISSARRSRQKSKSHGEISIDEKELYKEKSPELNIPRTSIDTDEAQHSQTDDHSTTNASKPQFSQTDSSFTLPESPHPPVLDIGITRQVTDSTQVEHMSLLELGEETMAQAMLIFLLADLRILSATGRIRTKFEHLALDSDRSPRLTSHDFAGFYDYDETSGVTASHIMALLLVEILREAEDVAGQKRRRHPHNDPPALLSPWVSSTDEVNARKVFKRNVRAANGLPSLLHCYNEMLGEDVNPRISRVSRVLYPLDEDIQQSGQTEHLLGSARSHDVESLQEPSLFGDYDHIANDTDEEYDMASPRIIDTGDYTINENSNSGALFTKSVVNKDAKKNGKSNDADNVQVQHPNLLIPTLPKPKQFDRRHGTSTSANAPAAVETTSTSGGREATLQHSSSHLPEIPPPVHVAHKRSHSINSGNLSAPASSRQVSRPPSSSFQPSHFNPNVHIDSDEDDDASVTIHFGATAPVRIKEIRERMEKAIPDKLANRVLQFNTQLKQNLPKSPAARQQLEMAEFAQVQTKLLKWEESNEVGSSAGETQQGNDTSSHKNVKSGEKGISGSKTVSATSSSLLDEATEGRKSESKSKPKKPSKNNQGKADPPQFHDTDTIRQLILQALDKRDFWRLGFIKTFFREGTVSHVLANSRAEMVWLSDWHTQYECTYALSIDREKRKVLLAFRGAYTERDWRHIVDWSDTATSNPVKEHYPHRAANIRVHSGFHKYLFRVRKDTGTTKYDEIAAKLAHYCDLTGHNTRITITGHSLGAALATIFSLYASTEERFTKQYGAIECVTFGAPCIANWRFAGAVKHQETVGKLRIAKFHVKGDSVPHLPPALLRASSKGAQYWHSGIDVSLPYIRKGKFFKTLLGQPKPKVTYWDPDDETYFSSLCRQFREYYMWNLPVRFWRFALFHTLVEHKKRMALVSKSDPNSLLAECSLKELYDMRQSLTRKALRRNKGKTQKKSQPRGTV